jgi:hypothetical protein
VLSLLRTDSVSRGLCISRLNLSIISVAICLLLFFFTSKPLVVLVEGSVETGSGEVILFRGYTHRFEMQEWDETVLVAERQFEALLPRLRIRIAEPTRPNSRSVTVLLPLPPNSSSGPNENRGGHRHEIGRSHL